MKWNELETGFFTVQVTAKPFFFFFFFSMQITNYTNIAPYSYSFRT